ncbi:hypothetical protein RRG08_008550 [Elysia crispata]|uniref:Uncharacterized protein n=1 Tax=Elysia crispata TaxID=231223 RepID=A0AAE0YMY9_9GAST|nr:hypothetical protein RRG08_008550 [Elysia crispata]
MAIQFPQPITSKVSSRVPSLARDYFITFHPVRLFGKINRSQQFKEIRQLRAPELGGNTILGEMRGGKVRGCRTLYLVMKTKQGDLRSGN